jgi:hypothetical protein
MTEPEILRQTIEIAQGTPRWAFLAALQALEALTASGASEATVTLYADGSGELRIPGPQLARLKLSPSQVYDLVGSVRRDDDESDVVIRQCGGFAFRDLT